MFKHSKCFFLTQKTHELYPNGIKLQKNLGRYDQKGVTKKARLMNELDEQCTVIFNQLKNEVL